MNQGRPQNWAMVLDSRGQPVELDFQDWRCRVLMERYSAGGGLSLRLVDVNDGSSIARATANFVGLQIGGDEVLIKNHAENTGVLDALLEAGLIVNSGHTVESKGSEFHLVRVVPLLLQQWFAFRKTIDAHSEQRGF